MCLNLIYICKRKLNNMKKQTLEETRQELNDLAILVLQIIGFTTIGLLLIGLVNHLENI